MAKICNSRSKVYETRGVVEDEPVEHIESEGERLIKQMVQKQLDPHVNLGQELKREQNFKSVQETLPLTAYVRGETTLKEFEQTAEKAAHIEELKSFGLLNDEIQLLLDFERDILAEKYKKTDRSILSSQIESILKKIECARTESNYSLEQSSSLTNNRHERELSLCVKPESVHTKLLRFVLSCQKTKTDARPPNHPINNLKNIEKELFGHLDGAKRNKKSCINKSAKLSSRSNETVFQGFSYENGNSLWDVTKVKTCTKRKSTETSSHIYTCKPECLYTVKKGEIIPVGKRNVEEKKDKIENDIFKCSGEFVVSDMRESTIPLVPVEDISKNCLSIQEIKSISKFANYVEGTPTKVLYVKNLAGSVINDDLVSLFGHFESDTGTRIVYRLLTGRMRGQAFVTFPSTSLAKKAMNLVNGYILKGKPLILQYGKANKDDDNGNNEAVRKIIHKKKNNHVKMHNNCQRKVIPLLNSVSHWCKMKDFYLCYYCNFSVAEKKKNENTGCRDDDEEILDSFTDRLVQEKIIKWESINKIRMSSTSREKICQSQENGSNKQFSSQNTQESTTHTNKIVKHFLHECHKRATQPKKPNLLNGMHVHVRKSDNISIVPTVNDVSNILSSIEFKNKAHDLHLAQVMWRNGHFENALNLFWSTYEENLNIRKKIKCILQVNFADAISKKGEAVLVIIINFSKKFVKKYNDYTLLSYVWESCFVSKWHSDNQIASDLLEKYPELKDLVQLRVHRITSVSLIYHKIDVVQRLFEVLLKYNMKTQYELVLRSLFDYACSIRDFYACSAIVQSCSDLDVTLTDIQNSRFLNLFCQDDAHRDAKLSIKTWSTKRSKFTFKF